MLESVIAGLSVAFAFALIGSVLAVALRPY